MKSDSPTHKMEANIQHNTPSGVQCLDTNKNMPLRNRGGHDANGTLSISVHPSDLWLIGSDGPFSQSNLKI